ncbi:hypothetical protein ACFPRL_31965 [Pseudoclavibacter helvolus]
MSSWPGARGPRASAAGPRGRTPTRRPRVPNPRGRGASVRGRWRGARRGAGAGRPLAFFCRCVPADVDRLVEFDLSKHERCEIAGREVLEHLGPNLR